MNYTRFTADSNEAEAAAKAFRESVGPLQASIERYDIKKYNKLNHAQNLIIGVSAVAFTVGVLGLFVWFLTGALFQRDLYTFWDTLWELFKLLGSVAAAGLIGLLSLAVGGVLGYLISEVLFLGSNRKYRKSIHMLRWNLCKKTLACNAEARGFYGVDEDGIVTKCYECFDPAFTLKDVSVSVRQGELFLAPACRYVFVYGDQDFGRYAIPFGEIADCSLADWGKVEAVSVTLRDGRRVMLGKRAWEQCKNIRLREGGEEERATEEKGRE